MGTSSIEAVLARVRQAVEQGQLWRAKEILLGNSRHRGYDPVLFEHLGLVLQQMGDAVEAGKYLFLSGVRKSEYEAAIALFVNRYTRRDPLQLYHALPRPGRLARRDAYPPVVAAHLEQLGLPATLPLRTAAAGRDRGSSAILGLGCLLTLVVILLLAFIGFRVAWEWLWRQG